MLGLNSLFHPPIPIPILKFPIQNLIDSDFRFKSDTQIRRKPRNFVVFAENGNKDLRDDRKEGDGGGGDEVKRDREAIWNIRWGDLLEPDPDNIVAVGLTGLLAWASVQVLWQLLFIALAILVAALKYSFIAALLIFILITLL